MTRNSNIDNNNDKNNNNRPQGYRLSAPDPYRPNDDELFNYTTKRRPNSQIILPTSMRQHNSVLPQSDQEFHTLARILNWPSTATAQNNNNNNNQIQNQELLP